MENPRYHAEWQAKIDAVLANPATSEQAQTIVAAADLESDRMERAHYCGASRLKVRYDALVAAGVISE